MQKGAKRATGALDLLGHGAFGDWICRGQARAPKVQKGAHANLRFASARHAPKGQKEAFTNRRFVCKFVCPHHSYLQPPKGCVLQIQSEALVYKASLTPLVHALTNRTSLHLGMTCPKGAKSGKKSYRCITLTNPVTKGLQILRAPVQIEDL